MQCVDDRRGADPKALGKRRIRWTALATISSIANDGEYARGSLNGMFALFGRCSHAATPDRRSFATAISDRRSRHEASKASFSASVLINSLSVSREPPGLVGQRF